MQSQFDPAEEQALVARYGPTLEREYLTSGGAQVEYSAAISGDAYLKSGR